MIWHHRHPQIPKNRQYCQCRQLIGQRRHKTVEILNEESSMEFSDPIFKRNPGENVFSITVWKRYVPLLLVLSSLIFTIDNQFFQIGRTIPIEEKV